MPMPEMVLHLKIDLSEELRAAVTAAGTEDSAYEPWTITTPNGTREAWIDDRNQERWIHPETERDYARSYGWRQLYVKKES